MSLPRSTTEQRSRFYGDVGDLITVGFLTHPIAVNGVQMSLRSLGPGDLAMLRARVGRGGENDWLIWTVASSVWLVDGYSLLMESHAVPRLARLVARLPSRTRELLFSLVMGLFNRQNQAGAAAESFLYEDHSRSMWRTYGGSLPTQHAGIPGVERIGTNYLQRMWIAFNTAEDGREAGEMQWEGFKLMASAMAPKGIKKLDQRDRQIRADEVDRRQRVHDRFFYSKLGYVTPDGQVLDPRLKDLPGVTIIGAKSAEDLADEMKRWVKGEDDQHDRVVREYKDRIREGHDRIQRERETRLELIRQEAARRGHDLSVPTPLVGYTAGQLAEILQKRGAGTPGVRRVDVGPNAESIYQKYLAEEPDAGILQVEGELLKSPDGGRLAREVAQRQVPFGSGEEN